MAVGLVVAASAVFVSTPAYASKWYAASSGTDTPSCGIKAAPCRSITAAKAKAASGDTIEVGPGVYGDIDGSGTVGDFPGEEQETPPVFGCMIDITIPLTLVSQYGAGLTVLDAGGTIMSAVCVGSPNAAGTVLGKPGQGFTLKNGTFGLFTWAGVPGLTVEGNVAENSDSAGFNIQQAAGAIVKGNKATNNGTGGFFVFCVSAPGVELSGNLAQDNGGSGFRVECPGTNVTDNVAFSNRGFGFEIPRVTSVSFSKNTALGNGWGGIWASASGPATLTIGKNNIFGNGSVVPGYLGWASNCGLVLINGDPSQTFAVVAAGNFWGDASGPGADPADAAGGSCNQVGTGPLALTTSPFATNMIPISPQTTK